jgi:hypothetical protein
MRSNPIPAMANSSLYICNGHIYGSSYKAIQANPNKVIAHVTAMELFENLEKYGHLKMTSSARTKLLRWKRAIGSLEWYH